MPKVDVVSVNTINTNHYNIPIFKLYVRSDPFIIKGVIVNGCDLYIYGFHGLYKYNLDSKELVQLTTRPIINAIPIDDKCLLIQYPTYIRLLNLHTLDESVISLRNPTIIKCFQHENVKRECIVGLLTSYNTIEIVKILGYNIEKICSVHKKENVLDFEIMKINKKLFLVIINNRNVILNSINHSNLINITIKVKRISLDNVYSILFTPYHLVLSETPPLSTTAILDVNHIKYLIEKDVNEVYFSPSIILRNLGWVINVFDKKDEITLITWLPPYITNFINISKVRKRVIHKKMKGRPVSAYIINKTNIKRALALIHYSS